MSRLWINLLVILCLGVFLTKAIDEHRPKVKKDARGKRNLEYSIAHHYPIGNTYRLERRISTVPQPPRYITATSYFNTRPLFNPYHTLNTGRPHASLPAPPPYAVQMEPLVHYSQRDPLYDPKLSAIANVHNDLGKPDDSQPDNNNHVSEHRYVERPVYIREPEPIIEIIIKESNVTLPPPPQIVTPAPKKKKEEVQVFYVKYKKNPHGTGKDSVIYEKPIPAISPPVNDNDDDAVEDESVEEKVSSEHAEYERSAYVTPAPSPPSTTLRAIIKPDSEVFHSDDGIHVTFGSEQKKAYDDENEESAPRPAISFPQGRQLSFDGPIQKRNPQQSVFPLSTQRFPPSYRPFGNQSPQTAFRGPPSPNKNGPEIGRVPPGFHSRPPPTFAAPSFGQRQPVPYKPFDYRPTNNNQQIQFPRTQTHFPILPQQQQFNQPKVQSQRPPIVGPPHQAPQSQIQSQIHKFHEQSFAQQSQFQQHNNNVQFAQQSNRQFPPSPQANPQFPNQGHHQQFPQQNQNFQHPSPQFPQPTQFPQPNSQFAQPNPSSQNQQFHHQNQGFPQQQHNPQFDQRLANQQFQQQQQQQHQQQQLQNLRFANQQNPQNNPPPSILPPGGELVAAVPKYEQHISVPSFITPSDQSRPQQTQQNQQKQNHQQSQQNIQQTQQSFQQNQQQNYQQAQQNFQQPQQNHQQTQQNHQQQQQNHQQSQLNHQQQQQNRQQNQPNHQQYFSQSQSNFEQNFQQQKSEEPQIVSADGLSPEEYRKRVQAQFSVNTFNSNNPLSQSQQFRSSFAQQNAPTTTTTTTERTTTAATTTTTASPKNKDNKAALNVELPDEVPDDLREQLISSGILANAQISILDYDKVGDIPLSALPPDQLANFYNAGGAAQLSSAASERVKTLVDADGKPVDADGKTLIDDEEDQSVSASEMDEVKVAQPVEMKVVRFDPQTEEAAKVKETYVKDDAKRVEPVVLNDQKYTKYLPLKVSGEQFPIPDVPELKGKNINSVVVLAPVDYTVTENARIVRDVSKDLEEVKFLSGKELKALLDRPTKENFEKWLEYENKTTAEKQSVVLLVTGSESNKTKEIFMYDIATKTVSKLDGELSTAFVEAAETNTNVDEEKAKSASNVVETMLPAPAGLRAYEEPDPFDLESSASEYIEMRVPIIDPTHGDDLEADGSEQFERFVDVSGMEINNPSHDLNVAATNI